jgi:hypothetical protein
MSQRGLRKRGSWCKGQIAIAAMKKLALRKAFTKSIIFDRSASPNPDEPEPIKAKRLRAKQFFNRFAQNSFAIVFCLKSKDSTFNGLITTSSFIQNPPKTARPAKLLQNKMAGPFAANNPKLTAASCTYRVQGA